MKNLFRKIFIEHAKAMINRILICLVLTSFITATVYSQKVDGIAKKLFNPVGFVSIPFQNNFDYHIQTNDGFKWTMNFQPIIPLSLNHNWSLINRITVPVIFQNNVLGRTSQTGIGDAVVNVLISPKKSRIIWGQDLLSISRADPPST